MHSPETLEDYGEYKTNAAYLENSKENADNPREIYRQRHHEWRDATFAQADNLSPCELAASYFLFGASGIDLTALDDEKGKRAFVVGHALGSVISSVRTAAKKGQTLEVSTCNDRFSSERYFDEGSRYASKMIAVMKEKALTDNDNSHNTEQIQAIEQIEKRFAGIDREGREGEILEELDPILSNPELGLNVHDKKEVARDILHGITLELYLWIRRTYPDKQAEIAKLDPENPEDIAKIFDIAEECSSISGMEEEVQNAANQVISSYISFLQKETVD